LEVRFSEEAEEKLAGEMRKDLRSKKSEGTWESEF